MNFAVGDIILINEEKYEVISFLNEVDGFDQEKGEFIGEHLLYELHLATSEKLKPTHALKIYNEKQKPAILLEISTEKPNYPKNSRTRGSVISYGDKKEIPLEHIKKI